MNILIIKLWAIGDIVMATPMVNALRKEYPNCRITWMADERYASILEGADGIDEIIALNASSWLNKFRKGHWISFLKETYKIRKTLKKRKFDVILNCSCDKWWGILLNAAPKTCAVFYKANSPYRKYYTDTLTETTPLQVTHFSLLWTSLLGCDDSDKRMFVGKLPNEEEYIREFLSQRGIDPAQPFVVISPFSSAEDRNWPMDRFAEVVDYIADKHRMQSLISHAPYDLEKAQELVSFCKTKPALSLSTTLLQYVSVLRAASLVICNDSSALHIGAAVGVPLVAIFGPVKATERIPYGVPSRLVSPETESGTGPIELVTTERVFQAIDEMIAIDSTA
jgi:heptosyltransferase-1